jgi:hypothetical protein
MAGDSRDECDTEVLTFTTIYMDALRVREEDERLPGYDETEGGNIWHRMKSLESKRAWNILGGDTPDDLAEEGRLRGIIGNSVHAGFGGRRGRKS